MGDGRSIVGLSGGYGTPALPHVMAPGMTEPAARTLPSAATTLVTLGAGTAFQTQAVLPVLVEDRDALARLTPGLGGFGASSWAELVALGDAAVARAALVFARMRPYGNLPEDVETTDEQGAPWYGWPSGSDHQMRQVFAWYVDVNNVYQFMQVQKYAPPGSSWGEANGAWRIWNKWGQDMTFVRPTPGAVWQAGWDLGDWLRQNAKTITDAVSALVQAIMTVMTFGAGTAVQGAAAGAKAAQEGFIQGMKGVATGDMGGAATGFTKMYGGLSSANDATSGELARSVKENLPWVQDVANTDFGKFLGGIVSSGSSQGNGGTFGLIADARALAKQLQPVTTEFVDNAKKLFAPPGDYSNGAWFDRGLLAGWANTVGTERAKVPWYGLVSFDAGAVIGATAAAQGTQPAQLPERHKATRLRVPAAGDAGASSWTLWAAGALSVGAVIAAAHYTRPGRAAWAATKHKTKSAYRAVANKPTSVKIMGGAAVASALAVIYALTRKAEPSTTETAPTALAPKPDSAALAPSALRR